jgi:hypothetical protein
LLGNFSVNMFSRQHGIVAGVVFYLVCVVSKEGRRLIIPRNFYASLINGNNGGKGTFLLPAPMRREFYKFQSCCIDCNHVRKISIKIGFPLMARTRVIT